MNASELATLNQTYGIQDQLAFKEGLGGLAIAAMQNDYGEATVALHGGHVLSFRPRGQAPVLWLSRHARFEAGRAIRGGIPVCWPWFADHPADSTKPAHGFVRTAVWSVVSSETSTDGGTRLTLTIAEREATKELWPHRFRLTLDVTLADVLQVKLTATNTGAQPFTCTGALHSYFSISSVADVRITGLDGCDYLDKVEQYRRKVQQGAVTIKNEIDRIYLDTTGACVIEDSGMRRRIAIAKNGSRTTVVWNPWIEKAAAMKDFGDDEYQTMVCVETANAAEDVVALAPGESHTVEADIRSEAWV